MNLKEKCLDPDSADILLWEPAQSKRAWTIHKTGFVWKFTGKEPDAESADIVLREPGQWKCTWTFHKSHCLDFFLEKCRTPIPRTSFCASLRSRNAHGHCTRAIFVWKSTGKIPNAPATTSIKHWDLTVSQQETAKSVIRYKQ